MNPYLQEIPDVHVLTERWLSQGEGSVEALITHFTAEFIMIPPGGEKMDYPAASRFFHHTGATRPESHIVVDQARIISEWRDGTAV